MAYLRYPRSIAYPLALRRPLAMPALPDGVYPAAVLLALVLPFEVIKPVLTTAWFSLTDEKLVLLLALAAWLCLGARALPIA
jgi:hypothetical protein